MSAQAPNYLLGFRVYKTLTLQTRNEAPAARLQAEDPEGTGKLTQSQVKAVLKELSYQTLGLTTLQMVMLLSQVRCGARAAESLEARHWDTAGLSTAAAAGSSSHPLPAEQAGASGTPSRWLPPCRHL